MASSSQGASETTRNGRSVVRPPIRPADPYTMAAKLCDPDGIVRKGVMHHGTDYPCTGHAHFAGDHIVCTSVGHLSDADLDRLLAWLEEDDHGAS